MILTVKEKERIINGLSWMVEDMKHRHDEMQGTLGQDSASNYSPQLTEVLSLLKAVKEVNPVEVTVTHKKVVALNCRHFVCRYNEKGVCALSKITLENSGSVIIGRLNCVEAEGKDEG